MFHRKISHLNVDLYKMNNTCSIKSCIDKTPTILCQKENNKKKLSKKKVSPELKMNFYKIFNQNVNHKNNKKSKIVSSAIEINPSTEYSTKHCISFLDSKYSNFPTIKKNICNNENNFHEIKVSKNKIKNNNAKEPMEKTKLSILTQNINNSIVFLNQDKINNKNEQNQKLLKYKYKFNIKTDNTDIDNKQIPNSNKLNYKSKNSKKSTKSFRKKNSYIKINATKSCNKNYNDEKFSYEQIKPFRLGRLIENKQNQYIKEFSQMLEHSSKNIINKNIKKIQYLESQGYQLDDILKDSCETYDGKINNIYKTLETPVKNNKPKKRINSKLVTYYPNNSSTSSNTKKNRLFNISNELQKYNTIKNIAGYFRNNSKLKIKNKNKNFINKIRKPKIDSMEYVLKINSEVNRNKFSNLFATNENFHENFVNDW